MILECINDWTRKPGCCTSDATDELFMGVRITEGKSVIAEYRQPYQVWFAGEKLMFRTPKGNHDDVYYLSNFDKTKTELMDILKRCASGAYGMELAPNFVEFIVNSGDQSIFEIPLPAGGTRILDVDYYLVFINGLLASVGNGDFEYVLDVDGNIYCDTPIPDETPEIQNVVSVYYWYKK